VIADFREQFRRYRATGEQALAQIPDAELNRVLAPEGNSAAMLVRHISGNLVSRFTDFLESDGEKPWRHRDAEFETRPYSRAEIDRLWATGWGTLERELDTLTDAQLEARVLLKGDSITVHGALCRALAHMAYHIGQIVLLARVTARSEWRWLTIPKKPTDHEGPA
jgi:uncharacterized damage-inducible protein DinB